MIYKIYKAGNYTYFQWQDVENKIYKKRFPSSKLRYEKGDKTFNILYNERRLEFNPEFANGLKENGTPYSEIELENFLNENTSNIGGSSTEATLASIDAKTPALGQALASGSSPVVLPLAQIAALTPPPAITGFNLEATQLLVKANTDNLDVALSTRLKPSDTLTAVTTVGAVTAITNALPIGDNIIGRVFLANRTESLLGGIAINDLEITAGQRIKSLLFTNNTPAIIYLQIFNKASALALADVPLNGFIIRVPPNSTIDKNTGDFGEAGILYAPTVRIGLSSTFDTYTAISPTNTSINVITVA
jgi:hypothetical protein